MLKVLKNRIFGTVVEKKIMELCSRPEVFCKKGVLGNFAKFTGKHLCQSLFFNKVAGAACNFIKKEILAQLFSCEFCEISKNTFSQRTPLVAASVMAELQFKCMGSQKLGNISEMKRKVETGAYYYVFPFLKLRDST